MIPIGKEKNEDRPVEKIPTIVWYEGQFWAVFEQELWLQHNEQQSFKASFLIPIDT